MLPLLGHTVMQAVAAGRRAQLGGLGDARIDIVNALSVIMGRDKAEKFFADFEALVEARARAGAEAAIPGIRAEVRQEANSIIRPWMVGAFGGVLAAATLGLVALKRSRRRGR